MCSGWSTRFHDWTLKPLCVQVQVSFEDRDHLWKEEIEAHQEDAQAVLKYRGVIDRALYDQMHHVPKNCRHRAVIQHGCARETSWRCWATWPMKQAWRLQHRRVQHRRIRFQCRWVLKCSTSHCWWMWWWVKVVKFPDPDSSEKQAKVPREVELWWQTFSAVQSQATWRRAWVRSSWLKGWMKWLNSQMWTCSQGRPDRGHEQVEEGCRSTRL